MNGRAQTRKVRLRLATAWVVASVFSLSYGQANAAVTGKKNAAAVSVVHLLFNKVAPLSGGLSVSADGRTAAHIAANGEIVLWEPAGGKQLETIPADDKKPSAVALSPDGDLLAIGYLDSRVILWSRRARKVMREYGGHLRAVSALAFSPDGKLLASGANDGTTQLWEAHTGRRLRVFDSRYGRPVGNTGGVVVALGFSGDGRALVVNEWYTGQYSVDRGTTVWDIDEGIETSNKHVTPPNTDHVIRAGHALGGGGWLLAYTGNKGLMVERLDACGSQPRQLASGGYADTVAADAQGRWVAASAPHQLTFFGMSGDTSGRSVALPSKSIALAAHPDGRSVLALLVNTDPAGNVMVGAVYRVAVPEALWRLPPMAVKPGATHCPPSEAARKLQNFRFPDKPVELPVVARLVPTREMVASPSAGSGRHSTRPLNPARDLYFARDDSLYVLYHYRNDSDLSNGVAVWDFRAQRLLRAHFKDSTSYLILRLRDGWAGKDDVSTLNNLLTGKLFLRFKDRNVQDGQDGLSEKTIVSDSDTGEVYRIVEGRIERYAADGRRLPDLVFGAKKPIILAARNGRLAALYDDNRVQVWQMGPTMKSRIFGPLRNEGNCEFDKLTLFANGRYLHTEFNCGDGGSMDWMFDFESARWVPIPFFAAPLPARANRAVVLDARPHRLAIFDLDKAEIIAILPRHRSRNKHGDYERLRAAISDDGRLVANASPDGLVRVWDIDARRMVGEINLGGVVTAMAFDAGGRHLAVGREDGQVVVFQLSTPLTQ